MTDQPKQTIEERVSANVGRWRNKLLDLSGRNRALNFRPTKASTVVIEAAEPSSLFERLVEREEPLTFEATVRDAAGGESAPYGNEIDQQHGHGEGHATQGSSTSNPGLPSPRQAGPLLVRATPETLDTTLRRIDEKAQEWVEEQGVNVLFLGLGMLQYALERDTEETSKAPLLLVPVRLVRKSLTSGYRLRRHEDEPMVNPALAELLRSNFGAQLPELPDRDEEDQLGVQRFFDAIAALAAEMTRNRYRGWTTTTEVVLGLFAFQKLLMFKDLESNADALVRHPLVRRLVGRQPGDPINAMGLPKDVSEAVLDSVFPPEATAQVVDADSSQLRALLAVSRGHSLVIEGPPGTGKSQTITNLVAQALFEGKSVLFVAEKMAALAVVHERLVAAGLGEFCLELHSTKANKRAVLDQVSEALDSSLQRMAVVDGVPTLPNVRSRLTEYARTLHSPVGRLGLTPYQAVALLDRLRDAPNLRYSGPRDVLSWQEFEHVERLLADCRDQAALIGPPGRHPWRDASLTYFPRSLLDELSTDLRRLIDITSRFESQAHAVRSARRLAVSTLSEADRAERVASVLERSPGVGAEMLLTDAWNQPPPAALELVRLGRRVKELAGFVGERFVPTVIDRRYAEDVAYVSRRSSGFLGWSAFLSGRYRAIRRHWSTLQRGECPPTLQQQTRDLARVDDLVTARDQLVQYEALGRATFGGLWQGESTDWNAAEGFIAWIVEARAACVTNGVAADELACVSTARPDYSSVHVLAETASELREALSSFGRRIGWPNGYLQDSVVAAIGQRLHEMFEALSATPQWAAFEQARQAASATVAAGFVGAAMNEHISFQSLSRAFRQGYLQPWLDEVVGDAPVLREFQSERHEARVRDFCALDRRALDENQRKVVGLLRDRVQQRLGNEALADQLDTLRKEMVKRRSRASLRRTLRESYDVVRTIKPCFLMSPMTVAQYLDGSVPSFDLVVFDEASQLPPEDAVGAIARGKQLVVVGDPKQLPPTNFFSTVATDDVPTDEDGSPIYEDAESVLEAYLGAGVPLSRLKWHYRSRHESLITFSNVNFYNSELMVFPSPELRTDRAGLSFEFVEAGVYEGAGLNRAEARRVADAVMAQLREYPDLSLGVGTFSQRQQLAIRDELEQRRRADPSLEGLFASSRREPFFVKNLENIQGDERDVVFLSVTYAKAPDGRLRYNFGPLNSENGWRRLNVIASRAKQRMRVFSSIRAHDIALTTTTSNGPQLLKSFLAYAETGTLDTIATRIAAEADSPFEREVAEELARRGIRVQPQVGVVGYRIDIGVLDDTVEDRYVCGIECDGLAYHSSETARDRDRLRQQVLEARGWIILRVWSTDWFKDRQGQIERLLRGIDEARRSAAQRGRSSQPAEVIARPTRGSTTTALGLGRPASSDDADVEVLDVSPSGRIFAKIDVAPYRQAQRPGWVPAGGILDCPLENVVAAVALIADQEGPIHVQALRERVRDFWGTGRLGTRIVDRIREAVDRAAAGRLVAVRGEFLWPHSGEAGVRRRTGQRLPPELVAPEEYEQAVVLVLRAAGSLQRDQLAAEVRHLLGVARTASLVEAVDQALATLLGAGTVGEGSHGVALRQPH